MPLAALIAADEGRIRGHGDQRSRRNRRRGHDQDGVYAEVAKRHPNAAVILPPRATAVPSEVADTAPTQRDGHLRCIAATGRRAWQTSSDYNKRAKVEAAIGR